MSLPTVHHVFCKADPIGEKDVRSQIICLEANLPSFDLADDPAEFYEMEAAGIARVILETLPQATIERLVLKLLECNAGLYRGRIKGGVI